MRKDSGVKYLFAGLLLVIGLVMIVMFFKSFSLWVRYHEPKLVSIEKVALDRVPLGARVRVEGIVDPRHTYRVKEPGGEGMLEIGLLLDDDKPMRQWLDAIERDTKAFNNHLPPAMNDELKKRGIKEYLESVDNYDARWNKLANQLNTTIRDAWPNYAVGFATSYEGDDPGFYRRNYPERNWVLEGYHPAGGPKERPEWPEDIELSNPIKASELPKLREYLDGEVSYYKGSAEMVKAELAAFKPSESFGRHTTVVGIVRPLPREVYDSYEALDDLAEDAYFYIDQGGELDKTGIIVVPIGIFLVLLTLGLMAIWAISGRNKYAGLSLDGE